MRRRSASSNSSERAIRRITVSEPRPRPLMYKEYTARPWARLFLVLHPNIALSQRKQSAFAFCIQYRAQLISFITRK